MTLTSLALRPVRILLVALTAAGLSLAVYADSLQDAGKLLRQGQHQQALE